MIIKFNQSKSYWSELPIYDAAMIIMKLFQFRMILEFSTCMLLSLWVGGRMMAVGFSRVEKTMEPVWLRSSRPWEKLEHIHVGAIWLCICTFGRIKARFLYFDDELCVWETLHQWGTYGKWCGAAGK